MTKEVIITLRGVQFGGAEDSAQPVEIVTPGEYYYKNGQHYLIFEETTEGFREVTHNLYKFTEDRLMVHKKGLIDTEMIFEKGKKTISAYHTPLGRMDMNIAATDFCLKVSENQLDYRVDYALNMGEGFAADCQVNFNVKSRDWWYMKEL